MNEKLLCHRIKRLRLSKKMTLDMLAKRTGFTVGYFSRIENSDKAPPISTLSRIAQALKVDISFLLFDDRVQDAGNMVITRKGDSKKARGHKASYGYRYELLASKKIGKNMEPYLIYPDFEYSAPIQHDGEEFFYVLEGKVEFVYGDARCILEAGDSMYFDAHIPHFGMSLGDQKAKVLIIIYSYRRT